MASSAKFLEEALNTDVDESAVSAIVGSLETQLQTEGATGPASQQELPPSQGSPQATNPPAVIGPINNNNQENSAPAAAQPTANAAAAAVAPSASNVVSQPTPTTPPSDDANDSVDPVVTVTPISATSTTTTTTAAPTPAPTEPVPPAPLPQPAVVEEPATPAPLPQPAVVEVPAPPAPIAAVVAPAAVLPESAPESTQVTDASATPSVPTEDRPLSQSPPTAIASLPSSESTSAITAALPAPEPTPVATAPLPAPEPKTVVTATLPAPELTPSVAAALPASEAIPAVAASSPAVKSTPAADAPVEAVSVLVSAPVVLTSEPKSAPVVAASVPAFAPVEAASVPKSAPVVAASVPASAPIVAASVPASAPIVAASVPASVPIVAASVPASAPIVAASVPASTPFVSTSARDSAPNVAVSAPESAPVVATPAPESAAAAAVTAPKPTPVTVVTTVESKPTVVPHPVSQLSSIQHTSLSSSASAGLTATSTSLLPPTPPLQSPTFKSTIKTESSATPNVVAFAPPSAPPPLQPPSLISSIKTEPSLATNVTAFAPSSAHVPATAVPKDKTPVLGNISEVSSKQIQANTKTLVSAMPSVVRTPLPQSLAPPVPTVPRPTVSAMVNGPDLNMPQDAPKPIISNMQLVNPGTSSTVQQATSAAQLANLPKVQPGEHVKIVYPGTGQLLTASNVVTGPNGKLTFPAAQLANGAMTVGQPILQNSTNTVSNTTGTTQSKPTALVIKGSGVVPTGMVSVPMSTVPVSTATSTQQSQQLQQQQSQPAKQVQTATAQTVNATAPGIVPSNVQILNVNAMRPATPVAGQQTTKQVNAARVVLGSQIMGARAGTPGITLQTLQGLQAGAGGGHLLLKTENGQFQLLRVGPAPTTSQPGPVTPSSIAGQTVVTTPGAAGQTYRLATLPAVSRLNAQYTGPTLATIKRPIQTVAPTGTTSTAATPATSAGIASVTTTAATPASATVPTTNAPTPQRSATAAQENNTKEKCRKFLANLLELSSREPKQVERNVRVLIQELIDAKVEPEEFCVRLEKLLNASPQPCLIGFLKKSLPLLRQALVTKELVIEGIRPPPPNVVFCIASATPAVTQQNQRPAVAVAPVNPPSTPAVTQVVPSQPHTIPASAMQTIPASAMQTIPASAMQTIPASAMQNLPASAMQTIPASAMQTIPASAMQTIPASAMQTIPASAMMPPQARMMGPHPGVINSPRPAQPAQQRMARPATTVVRQPTAFQMKTTTVPASAMQQPPMIRPPAPVVVQKSLPSTAAAKTVIQPSQVATSKASTPVISTNQTPKSSLPSIQNKQIVIKEKEKKTFSSAGYTGDDDINDVAAMGGVNLAEESQKILGSTKFVGTQIRSCKDEVFLHMSPLQQKINKIAGNYGLEEPSQEVASIISHAAQERLKNLVEKLAVIAEHRIDLNKSDPRYEITQDVRAQLKFLEDLDKVERKRHEEQEREVLLKAAKSRAKTEDPEQAKLKAKAKEMQRVEMEEARQREANQTALQAIGPRKKPKLDISSSGTSTTTASSGVSNSNSGLNRQLPLRARVKRVNYRDLLFLLEQEKETCRSITLYKSYLK